MLKAHALRAPLRKNMVTHRCKKSGLIAMASSTVCTYVYPPLHVCQCEQYHASLQHTSLILDIHVLINGPFPSCCLSRFRSESWCSTIVREMSLICIRMCNHFHLNGCTPGLALKLRHAATPKWAIDACQNKVSADQYHVNISGLKLRAHRGLLFF